MYIDEFTKHWDKRYGFTFEEAEKKKQGVDDAYKVKSANSKWQPARIIPDPSRECGYMVTISTKV